MFCSVCETVSHSRFYSAATQFGKECVSFVSNLTSVGLQGLIYDTLALPFKCRRTDVPGSSNYEILDRGFCRYSIRQGIPFSTLRIGSKSIQMKRKRAILFSISETPTIFQMSMRNIMESSIK